MKFKVGSKVVVKNVYSGGNFDDGDIVTIVRIGDEDGFDLNCYGAISPHDGLLWYLNEDEVAPATNSERIRAMSDEELAVWLVSKTKYQESAWSAPSYLNFKTGRDDDKNSAGKETLEWLQQPAEG